jgi:glycosyltransferase involved in cell wall biosynthesis
MSNLIDPKKVFVVVPAFNENSIIRQVINDLLAHHYNIVVVDDGSKEPAAELLNDLPVYFLRHPINLGQGAALQTGIEYALSNNAEYVITFDADGQHIATDIEQLLQPLINNEADIVLGSRFIKGSKHNMTGGRKILVQVGRWFNFMLTGLLLTDAHNGLRAMNKKAAASLHITQNGMAHATELLTEIKKKKLRYKEIPVTVHYTDYSKNKGQSAWSSFRIFFDLLLNKIFK